jgi:hypothetical protein
VLAHFPAEVLGRDGERLCASTGSPRGRPDGRVECDVVVASSGDPRPRVLPPAQRHERPVAAADRPALQAVGRPGPVEHAARVRLELRDTGPALQLV